jgi:hypothetical protein
VLVVPAVLLVADGNLSVQTVLMRFAAALALTWVAAALIGGTMRSGTGARDDEAAEASEADTAAGQSRDAEPAAGTARE